MSLDNYKKFLGQKIHVKMDRKMGERHPKYNFIYPISSFSYSLFSILSLFILQNKLNNIFCS